MYKTVGIRKARVCRVRKCKLQVKRSSSTGTGSVFRYIVKGMQLYRIDKHPPAAHCSLSLSLLVCVLCIDRESSAAL